MVVRKNIQESPEEVFRVKKQTIKETLTLSGEIDAEEKVTLKFPTSGKLSWVGVKEGDFVKKNQLIASLDTRELKNRLDRYLKGYMIARLDFEEVKENNWNRQYDLDESTRKKAQRILEKNQYNLDQAILDVEYQNLLLENSVISAPIDGIITQMQISSPGVYVTPASAVVEIVNPKSLYFSVIADQTDVVDIREKMIGEIILDSFPKEKGKGEVTYISFAPKQGETGVVYQIKINLDDKLKKLPLRIGMSGDVEFVTKERKDIIAVPQKFIGNDSKGNFVLVKKDGRIEKKYIKKGEEISGQFEVEGSEEGQILVRID